MQKDIKMELIPAIDLKDGQCVRLLKGEFDTVHKVAESPKKSAENYRHKIRLLISNEYCFRVWF